MILIMRVSSIRVFLYIRSMRKLVRQLHRNRCVGNIVHKRKEIRKRLIRYWV